jgi:hypothetical protein
MYRGYFFISALGASLAGSAGAAAGAATAGAGAVALRKSSKEMVWLPLTIAIGAS